MAIQLASVARYLQSKEIGFKEEGNYLLTDFEVETSAGKVSALMVFSTPLEGRVFSIESANFLPKEVMGKLMENRNFVLSLLNLGWRTPFGACEMNADCDELRFVIEVPLEDATLTEAQFSTLTNGVVEGTRMVSELALQALGKAKKPEMTTLEKIKLAADVITSDEASPEDKKTALEFVIGVAQDESQPTQERMAAQKLVSIIHEAIQKAEGKTASNPFLS